MCYHQELEEFERNGDVTLHVAFSRDQPKKVYVTHLLENNLEQIWDVIGNRNGHFYICGLVFYIKNVGYLLAYRNLRRFCS